MSSITGPSSELTFCLFAGPDLAVNFGTNPAAALAYMARNAERLQDGEAALFIFDAAGDPLIALVDARSQSAPGSREIQKSEESR